MTFCREIKCHGFLMLNVSRALIRPINCSCSYTGFMKYLKNQFQKKKKKSYWEVAYGERSSGVLGGGTTFPYLFSEPERVPVLFHVFQCFPTFFSSRTKRMIRMNLTNPLCHMSTPYVCLSLRPFTA